MFFILSKTLDFFLSPFIWTLAILLYVFFSKRSAAAKKKIYLAGLIVLLFFSNSFIVNEAFLAWEGRPVSAFHIPRSLGCFRKAGLNVQPYSVDFYAHDRDFDLDTFILPSASALERWSVLVHEMCGFVIYKVMGYS